MINQNMKSKWKEWQQTGQLPENLSKLFIWLATICTAILGHWCTVSGPLTSLWRIIAQKSTLYRKNSASVTFKNNFKRPNKKTGTNVNTVQRMSDVVPVSARCCYAVHLNRSYWSIRVYRILTFSVMWKDMLGKTLTGWTMINIVHFLIGEA